jgi:hypothetical protein
MDPMGEGPKENLAATAVRLHCPACRRAHTYAAPVYPCACGSPVSTPLLKDTAPQPITHRTWSEGWVAVRCEACGRQDQWPQPELGCACGTVLLIAVQPVRPESAGAPSNPPGASVPLPRAAARPAFRPEPVGTAQEAMTAAARYLSWLGFRDVAVTAAAGRRPATGIDLRGPGVIVTVDPGPLPAALRDIECLWLHGLTSSARTVFFSLAGYAEEALTRAQELHIPLFVLDRAGAPRPANHSAGELVSTGA